MWRVTFADLVYRYRQFLIAVLGAGVVLAMAILLAGLANGFSAEIQATVGGVGAQRWVLADSAHGRIASLGVFSQGATALIAHSPGVTEASPIAVIPQQVGEVNGHSVTINIFGVQPGGLGDPVATTGTGLTGSGQVVTDTKVGAAVGSTITIGAKRFTVVGNIENRTMLGGGAILYITLPDAQALALGGRPLVTAVVTQGVPQRLPQGLSLYTNQQVETNTLSALSSAVSSINNTKYLMYAVAPSSSPPCSTCRRCSGYGTSPCSRRWAPRPSPSSSSLAVQAVVVTLVAAIFATIMANFMHGLFAQPVAIPRSAFATLPASPSSSGSCPAWSLSAGPPAPTQPRRSADGDEHPSGPPDLTVEFASGGYKIRPLNGLTFDCERRPARRPARAIRLRQDDAAFVPRRSARPTSGSISFRQDGSPISRP